MRIAAPGTRSKSNNRQGFTLLEVLLSAAIGVLLMAALYVAMQVQLDHAQAGREAVEESLLTRALLRRMSNDIAPGLAPTLPNTSTTNAATTNTNTTNTASTTTSTAPVF